jgi:hypothetical protein
MEMIVGNAASWGGLPTCTLIIKMRFLDEVYEVFAQMLKSDDENNSFIFCFEDGREAVH